MDWNKTKADVISGKIFIRNGLENLIAYARPNDLLCVVRLDRLGRSLKELLETVETLKHHNIGLMSLEEKIDTSSAAGELIFHVFGAIAHFERRFINNKHQQNSNSWLWFLLQTPRCFSYYFRI